MAKVLGVPVEIIQAFSDYTLKCLFSFSYLFSDCDWNDGVFSAKVHHSSETSLRTIRFEKLDESDGASLCADDRWLLPGED